MFIVHKTFKLELVSTQTKLTQEDVVCSTYSLLIKRRKLLIKKRNSWNR